MKEVFDGLLIGDESICDWDLNNAANSWNFKKISEKCCNISKAAELFEQNVTEHTRAIVIQAVHHEFVNDFDGVHVLKKEEIRLVEIINSINQLTLKWEEKFPYIKLLWAFPSAFDFAKYNIKFMKERLDDPVLNDSIENSQDYSAKYLSYTKELLDLASKKLVNFMLIPNFKKESNKLTRGVFKDCTFLCGKLTKFHILV